jgi:penicillin-binding protein 2
VELKWQANLSGTRGGEQVEVDAAGRKIRTISMKSPLPGANIYLTIEKDLQALAEEALLEKKGAIVALDPGNGAVLALASSPSVDPNLFIGGIDKTTWQEIATSKAFPLQDRALSGQYPPASVFKIIVALAGLAEGEIDPEEIVDCKGFFFLGRHRSNCWKKYGHGNVNLHTALVQSCDVYFYQMGKKLGVETIARYARKFRLGKIAGIDVGQEKEGLVPTRAWKQEKLGVPWQEGETVSMSIGQSFLLVTPIQAANMIASVFNGGFLYRPQVTKWVGRSKTETIHEFTPKVAGKINFSQDHLEIVKNALIGVVNESHGTGSKAKVENITVAGKTGTAQVVAMKDNEEQDDGENGIPAHHRDHAWFVAVAPAESPKIAIAVVIEHGGHGGSAAAPIAGDMIALYLKNSDS